MTQEERRQRDLEPVQLKCDRCGIQITLKYGSWRRNKQGPHYCSACLGKVKKERFDALPEDVRSEKLAKKNAAISRGHRSQTPEQRALSSQHRSEAWKNNPERQERHQQWLHGRWDNATAEELKANTDRLLEGQKKFWSNKDNRDAQSERARKKWFDQPVEEQERILTALNEGKEKYYNSLTPERKQAILEKQRISMLEHYQNMSEEDHMDRAVKMQKWMSAGRKPNELEKKFVDLIKSRGIVGDIEFNYVSEIEHPEFKSKFPSNPFFPDRPVTPFHAWDFRLNLLEESIYVDIDGKMHNPKTTMSLNPDMKDIPHTLGDQVEFYDAQRPYQTDRLKAYIVQAHNGKLLDDTPVLALHTGETMTLKALMAYLWFASLSKDEQKELLKDLK